MELVDNNAAITTLVLCGGAGQRLGGIDKPLREIAGRPLIEWVLDAMRDPSAAFVISANRNLERYRRYAATIADDPAYANCGPLAGVATGLAAARSCDVLCVPGDAPHLPPDLLARLARARKQADCAAAVVYDGSGMQPLCFLLQRAHLSSLKKFIGSDGRAAHQWIASMQPAIADCSDWPRWGWSVNTEAEWAAAEYQLLSGIRSSPRL
jgi:molybdopterin-guanine dinucleotide biosynthesis protein A